MKASPLISAVALIMSLGAGFVAMRARTDVSQAKINTLVDSRLAEREMKFVQAAAPKYRAMFAAMDETKYGKDWNPKTLEELFAPIVNMASGTEAETK